jgi:hypothetical protein
MGYQSALQDRIFVRLAERAWAGKDFDITADDSGTVTISGTVPSDHARQRVLRIVRTTPGVQDVNDRLTVKPSSAAAPPQAPPDDQLSKQVAQKIANAIPGSKAGEDWWFSGWRVEGPSNTWDITVDADQGKINLDGDVPRSHLERQAVEAALNVPGVRSVRSDINVEPMYGGYPYGYPYYGYGYGAYPYPAYGPRRPSAYDVDHNTDRQKASMNAEPSAFHGLAGVHRMSGQVTSVDHSTGMLSLKTHEGTLDLHFPPAALKTVQQGDQMTVELGFREAGNSQRSGS